MSRNRCNTPILNALLYLFVGELVLCGSGQIIHVYGGLTGRMFIFVLMLLATVPMILKWKMKSEVVSLFLGYLFLFLFSIQLALINENTENLLEDIKPGVFFFSFFFLYWVISSSKVEAISRIIRWGVLFMALIYIAYLIAMKILGLMDFNLFYDSMQEESDFMFREDGGELFYKGFLFLPIGLIFWLKEKKWIPCLIILVAVYFTLTRGFYIITLLGISLYYLLYPRYTSKKLLILLGFGIAAIVGYISCLDISDIVGDRLDGDLVRIQTFEQVGDRITLFSFFFGHGFGAGVPIRQVHMECAYLEIFHKQGILGLIYWFWLLIATVNAYKRSSNSSSVIYLIAVILVYVQSLFNPYISNPIGMGMVMISYFVCRSLSEKNEDSCYHSNISSKIV